MLKRWISNIKRWFSYYKVVSKIYDFDYSSILEVEKYQLTRVRNSIAHYHHHLCADRDIERINLALKLLDIILEEGCSEMLNQNEWTIPVYVNTRNYKRFWFEKMTIDDALQKDNLRIEKAWFIYHKLRLYYLRSFWD